MTKSQKITYIWKVIVTKKKKKTLLDSIIVWIGTPSSLVVHTLFFVFMLSLRFFGVAFSDVLLVLTTVVSLEAIYLSIFIQMSVNRQADEQEETRSVLSTLQESVESVQETMEEVQETIDDEREKDDSV